MSLICPGANAVGKFWSNIAQGVDSITEAPPEVIEPFYFDQPDSDVIDRFYCRRGGFITPGVVDPMRYGILPVAADGADPDQLLSYTLAEEALSDAGILAKNVSLDKASVIIGRGNFAGLPQLRGAELIRFADEFTALLRHALPHLPKSDLDRVKAEYQTKFGRFQGDTAAATMPNLVAAGVANHFDMHGPAYVLDAACASGIVALDHASRLLVSGESDVILVGAMHSAQSSIFWGAFTMMGALSRRGEIAPFSAQGDGLLIGQGAGFMVVKTLERAIADNDRIYAVVKSTAIGSDGGGHSVLITDSDGQAAVIRRAWERSGLDPADVAYIEAHGTGTPVGDATEIETLTKVFGDKAARRAFVGSVKSNIGHLMPAAGMMGLMKTALALHHRQIPPTLHCAEPLEAMAASRFTPPDTLIDWQASGLPLIAGVDAFGFGGVDGHAVLTAYQEPARQAGRYRSDRRRQYSPQAYAVAGSTREDVLSKIDLEHFVNRFGSVVGQPGDPCRLVIFNPTPQRVKLAIDIIKRGKPWLGRSDIWYSEDPLLLQGGKVAFLFPGWDASAGVEHDSLVDELGLTWMQFPEESGDAAANATIAHFKTSLLVNQALEATGVKADYLAGHSIGEWHAGRAAGMLDESFDHVIFDLTHLPMDELEGLIPEFHLVVANGELSDDAEAEILADFPDVYLTNDNCPSQRVFCAVGESTKPLIGALEAHHVVCQVLPFGTALHTPLFKHVVQVPLKAMSQLPVRRGKAPVISAVSLAEIPSDGVMADASFGGQLTEPVYFRQLIEALYDQGVRVFIQSGVGSLTSFIDDTLAGREFGSIQAISSLRSAVDQLRRVHALLFVMGGAADLDFLGMPRALQNLKALHLLPNGSPILTELASLDEVLAPADRCLAEGGKSAATGSAATRSVAVPDLGRVSSEGTPQLSPVASSAAQTDDSGTVSTTGVGGDDTAVAPKTPLAPPPLSQIPLNHRGLPARGFTRAWPAPGQMPPVVAMPSMVLPAPATTTSMPPVAPLSAAGPQSLTVTDQTPVVAVPASPDAALTAASTPSMPPAPRAQAPAKPSRAGTSFEVPLDLSLDDHPYVLDHSIVNQPADWPRKEDFYSVIPLTMSMELMAEVAMAQAPGLKVVKLGPITAMDFIAVTMPFHSTVQGFWKSEFTVALTVPGRLTIDVTLAEEMPPPPQADVVADARRDIGPAVREPMPTADQYVEYSFHRPRYWSAKEYTLYGEHGFHSIVEPRQGKGSLLDQMGQSIGLFLHLYMDENRVSFPVRVKEVRFYQDMFDQSGVFESYCVIRQIGDRFITGDIIYLRDGLVWAIARGWVNQRLGMDISLWESVNHPWRSVLAQQIAPGVYYYDSHNPTRSAGYFLVLCYLSAKEKGRADELATRGAQIDFLSGRVALKDAVRSWLHHEGDPYLYPIEVTVDYDENGKPIVRDRDGEEFPNRPEVSVAHSHGHGVAMVDTVPVGIDIEKIEPRDEAVWRLALTDQERELARSQGDTDEWMTRFWVAKEACAKRRGSGLEAAPKQIQIDRVEGESLHVGEVWVDTSRTDDGYIIGWTRRD
jgi:3-oxoacyl-(acyl-carrier-protein) synthase/phosphopantetheinyl transferase/malonyl CoA-acyl carrier protein transacylase